MVKNPHANAGDVDLIPGSGRCPGGRHGNALQYSCLEIPWTEQPGELQSTGLQRVRQHLATKEQQFFRQLHGDVIHIVYSSPI